MDTLTAAPMNTGPTDLAPVVARYLDELHTHQARFLDAVSQARGVLGTDAGQLAQLSAIQGRLTRQFFDAQRLILQRRAEVDAEVARIGAETEEHANVVLASAVAHAAADRFRPLGTADGFEGAEPGAAGFVEQSTRQAIAALGVLAVRTKADADALEQIINDALAPSEADGARMERELQLLLDQWWKAQTQEGRALIDDARARAAMRLHVAHIEACEIVGAATPSVAAPLESQNVLPPSVLAAIDLAAPGGLDAVLNAVAGSLTVAPPAVVARPATVPTATPSALPTLAPASDRRTDVQPVATAEQFHHFWQHEPRATAESTSSLHSILWRVVVPIGAVTSLLAVVMAWIG